MRKILILILATLWHGSTFCQERCGTMLLPQNNIRSETRDDFEEWLRLAKQNNSTLRSNQEEEVYQIPVVFHVIHDGSPVGSGSNVSDERILEQIEILNEDFRRLNTDASETLSDFQSVAADTRIEFVIAKQDPEGMPTTGILRAKGSQTTYSISEDRILMSESYWPQEDYMNIYITDLTGSYLGFAQFPFSNLSGIATELENYKITDGLVLDYNWVGNHVNSGTFDSYGRTATHEIGHWLGLRHIWGDGGCSFDDFCEDTPLASKSSTGCELDKTSCDSKDMVQNYMDYTDDVCMNLFTRCQKERMRTVLELSPRRKSLLTSHALQEPVVMANDLGIRSIAAPVQSTCSSDVTPRIEIRNYGTNTIGTYSISFYLNGSLIQTLEEDNSILSGDTRLVSFSSISLDDQIANTVVFQINSTNGTTDQNSLNDTKDLTLSPFENIDLPFFEDFESNTNYYRITESGNTSTWTFTNAPLSITDNTAAVAPFFNQTENFGERDMLLTKSLDLTGISSAQLSLRYAYAPRLQENSSDYYLDGLIIAVSTNCGEDYLLDNVLFEYYGSQLRTTTPRSKEFVPQGGADWDEINLNITKYAGMSNVQIAIIGINGGGNNIYVDELSVSDANLLAYDLGIREITNAPVVTCDSNAFPNIKIKNYGYQEIDKMSLAMTANGESYAFEYDNLNLKSGQSETITIGIQDYIIDGSNEFSFEITGVNDLQDERKTNNTMGFYTLLSTETDEIPVKEDFLDQEWLTFSPDGINQYEQVNLDGDLALSTNNFNDEHLVSSWLVTPSLSTNGLNEASLQFKYSYAERLGYNDKLQVLISVNCGLSYSELITIESEQLAITTSSVEWVPQTEEDWKIQYVDLTNYVGYSSIRLAFVFWNGNGNRLYLDDINLYRTKDPDIPDLDALQTMMAVYPNPAVSNFSVAFNFPSKKNVYLQLADLSGNVVFKKRYTNLLNNKFTFVAPTQSGIYILNVVGEGINQSKRIYIRQ